MRRSVRLRPLFYTRGETMKEEIKFSEKYNCYVSNMGYIIRKSGLKSYPTKRKDNGYYVITDGNGRTKRIHRIVAETFLGEPDLRLDVNHKDGDKSNNKLDNLEWVTRSENLLHAYSIGIHQKIPGEKNKRSKLTLAEAQEIYDSYETDGYHSNISELMKKYGVSPNTIKAIIKGVNSGGGVAWPEVNRNRIFPKNRRGGVAIQSKKEKWDCFCDGTSKRVAQVDMKTGEILKVYESANGAYKETGIAHAGMVANGKRLSAGGYYWKWVD